MATSNSTQTTPTQVANAVSKSLSNVGSSSNYYKDAPGYNPTAQAGKNLDGTSTTPSTSSSDTTGGNALTPSPTAGQPSPTTTNATPVTGAVQNAQTNMSGNAFSGSNLSSVGLGSVADQLKNAYTKAHTDLSNSGVDSPDTQGSANAGVKSALDSQPKTPPPPETPPAVDSFFDPNTNPAIQDSTKQLMEFLNPTSDRDMLNQHIQSLNTDKTQLAGLKTDLMNMKQVMAGTEDDLRDEITKSNGFATESQVQALAVARNKTLLRQSTLLQDQITTLQDTITNDTSLVSEDKQAAAQQATQRLGILNYQQTNYNNQMNAARDSIKTLLGPNMENATAVYNSVKGTPFEARYEKILGLPTGGMAQLASTSNIDRQIKDANLAHTLAETRKLNNEANANTPGTIEYNKNQDKLEQQYRQVLLKEVSNRSGDLGIQNSKVSQAIHLSSLLNQYKDTKGNYNVPTAQYAELAMGLANLLSPNGSAESDRQNIMSKTAASGLKGALQYITGTPQNGNTQAIIKNLADSIDRQGGVAEDLRTQAETFLGALAPTGLEQNRIDALNSGSLPSYSTYKKTGKVGGSDYTAPKLLDPKEVPTGYYQASDGLLYPR